MTTATGNNDMQGTDIAHSEPVSNQVSLHSPPPYPGSAGYVSQAEIPNDVPPPPYPAAGAMMYPAMPPPVYTATKETGSEDVTVANFYYVPSNAAISSDQTVVIATQPIRAAMPATITINRVKQPQTYLGLAIATCFCFSPIFGCFALCFSLAASASYGAGDDRAGRRHAQMALGTCVVGIVASFMLYLVMYFYNRNFYFVHDNTDMLDNILRNATIHH